MPDAISLTTGGLFSEDGVARVTQGLISGGGAVTGFHPRTRIRNHIVSVLRTAAMMDPSRIHSERVEPFVARENKWKLPSINVTTHIDESEIDSESPRVYKRVVTAEIDIIDGGVDAETRCDEIARLVEMMLLPDRFLGGHADDLVLGDTPSAFSGDGIAKFGALRLPLFVTYRDEFSQAVGDGLKSVHVNWDLGPEPDGQIEAEDELELEGS